MVTITTQTVYTTTIMSQYPIPISLPAPSQDSIPSLPERPTSVSTTSTLGSPFSPNPLSAPFTPSHLLEPPPQHLPTQQSKPSTIPAFPAVLDPTLLLSARQIKAEFFRRDRILARTIVGILAGRIELGILAPANGIGFPFSDKEQPKVFPPISEMWGNGRRRSRVVDLRDGIWRLGIMFIRIERGILKFFRLCTKIWRLGGLLWRNLISSRMIMGSISSIVCLCRIRRLTTLAVAFPSHGGRKIVWIAGLSSE